MIVDGKNAILGRLSADIAKKLLKEENVDIINAEKIIITGNPKSILEKYQNRVKRGSPQHGPFFPRTADGIVRRTIRGMLPYKIEKGRKAMSKLKVYNGVPKKFEGKETVKYERDIETNFISIEDLSKRLK